MALNDRQRRFVHNIAQGMSATQAYVDAGFSEKGAAQSAVKLLRNPKIQSFLAEFRAKAANDAGITVAKVLERFWMIATADPNELVEHRRVCCRYCWGQGFGYQYTAREMAERRSRWARSKTRKEGDVFDVQGGVGFDHAKAPNPACAECVGDGISVVVPKDTRKLSPAALALYAGVRVTRDGIDMRLHDQPAALAHVAKHLGMFVDRVEIQDWSTVSEDELRQLEEGKVPPRLKLMA